MPKRYQWFVYRRHNRGGEHKIQSTAVKCYADAVAVAKKWYKSHGVGYGIQILYEVPEIGERVRVRDYYLINSVEDIK
jgi:hypothetical protein